jgi:capsular polysaccharide biosynthesis protein
MSKGDGNHQRRGEEDDEEEGLDLGAITDWVGYVFRGPKRKPRRFFVLLILGLALGVAIFMLYPRSYSTEVKILAQRNLVLPALGNPNRTVPREADNPTKNVGDTILQHDNLVGLIKQVNLVDRWEGTRPPVLRWKDKISQRLSGPQTEQERMRSMEGVLEKKLTITNDETTITITAEWSDAQMAYDIASAVEKNFIDARYDAEISVINDAIDILQQHASEEKDRFDTARNDFESVQGKIPKPTTTTSTATARPRAMAPKPLPTSTASAQPAVDPALIQQLQDKRTEIQQVENVRASRVAELNKQLADALVQYRPEHPTVVAIKQKLADAQAEPGELNRLRGEEKALIEKLSLTAPPLATAIAAASSTPSAAATIAALTNSPAGSSGPMIIEEDPAVTVARMKLQQAAQKYADLETRIDGAKIELDIAKTAHKYRFSIVRPAEVSKRPHKPNPVMLFAGVVFLVFLISFGGVVVRERRLGLIVERWQVERKLKLPVLGELETS